MPPCFSPQLCPPLPGGNGCSGNLVLCGSCSALYRLQQKQGGGSVLLKRLLAGLSFVAGCVEEKKM